MYLTKAESITKTCQILHIGLLMIWAHSNFAICFVSQMIIASSIYVGLCLHIYMFLDFSLGGINQIEPS